MLKKLKSGGLRPPFEAFYIYLLSFFIGFAIADLSILNIRPSMLPTDAPPVRPQKNKRQQFVPKNDYLVISGRNIFNSDGKIPPSLASGDQSGGQEDAPAVLSQLPLKLLGTIVHLNSTKSVATIHQSNRNETISVKVEDSINNMAVVKKIERRKVIFRNSNNGRMEYIEIPEDGKVNLSIRSSTPPPTAAAPTDIEKRGEFDFSIKRSTLEKYTSDLSSILRQARMMPNIVPGSGGKVEGFKFVQIDPSSVFAALGFKEGDIIKSVDGEPVNSPTKAMELYNTLKSSNALSIGTERNGRQEEFRYNIE